MTDLSDVELIKPPRSQWRDVWDQFKSHKGAMAGAFVFITIVAVVFLGPFFWTIEATHIDIRARNQGPSWAHPFGTDQLGRDTFARMMAGGKPQSRWVWRRWACHWFWARLSASWRGFSAFWTAL